MSHSPVTRLNNSKVAIIELCSFKFCSLTTTTKLNWRDNFIVYLSTFSSKVKLEQNQLLRFDSVLSLVNKQMSTSVALTALKTPTKYELPQTQAVIFAFRFPIDGGNKNKQHFVSVS